MRTSPPPCARRKWLLCSQGRALEFSPSGLDTPQPRQWPGRRALHPSGPAHKRRAAQYPCGVCQSRPAYLYQPRAVHLVRASKAGGKALLCSTDLLHCSIKRPFPPRNPRPYHPPRRLPLPHLFRWHLRPLRTRLSPRQRPSRLLSRNDTLDAHSPLLLPLPRRNICRRSKAGTPQSPPSLGSRANLNLLPAHYRRSPRLHAHPSLRQAYSSPRPISRPPARAAPDLILTRLLPCTPHRHR